MKEGHINELISMIYSVDCVSPSSSYVCSIPWVVLSVSEKANLQIHLVGAQLSLFLPTFLSLNK